MRSQSALLPGAGLPTDDVVAAQAPLWVSGGWWLVPADESAGGNAVAAFHPTTGTSLEATGELAVALVEGRTDVSGLDTLCRLRPELGALVESVNTYGKPTPLTRDLLLRGDGWERLFVELTARCNENCVHCYAESSPSRTEALTHAQLEQVIDDGARLGFQSLQLTGGDPLIHPDLPWATARAHAAGYKQIEIYTNGLALTQSMYDTLRPANPQFAFSFYSSDAETHDAMTRVPGSWDRTVKAIRRALDGGSHVRAGMVLTPPNATHGPATKAFLVDLGVNPGRITVDVSREVGRGSAELDLLTNIDGPASHGAPADGASKYERQQFWGRAAVSYDGNIYPCIFGRSFMLGSLHRSSLYDVLTEPRAFGAVAAGMVKRSQGWAKSLSCWQCQLRAELLLTSSPVAPELAA